MGIVSYGSNMEVTNTQIKNISRSSTYQSYNGRSLYFANGSGIYSQGNGAYTINIRGNGLQFQKCFTGVTIQDQDFLIQNCIMTDMTAGIQINSCINRVGMINQNYIESTDRGINLWLNDNARTISIIDNEIYAGFNLTTTKHPGAIGIGIREGHHSASMFTHVTMLLNTIYVDHGLFGILMQSADHITANGNQVFLRFDNNNPDRPNEIVRGISINDCSDSYLYANTVTGSNPSGHSTQYGFECNLNSGSPNYLTCNEASNTLRNFYFGGGTNTTQIAGSTIGDGFEGLHLTNACIIGQQWHMGNCFSNNYGQSYGRVI